MASTTVTVITAAISGTTSPTTHSGVASSQTATITPSTAQSALDFATLHIRICNTSSTASVTETLAAGTRYSGIGVGTYTVTVATDTTVIVGGHDFEGSRFLNTAGTVVFTQAGTGPSSWEAYQSPRAGE